MSHECIPLVQCINLKLLPPPIRKHPRQRYSQRSGEKTQSIALLLLLEYARGQDRDRLRISPVRSDVRLWQDLCLENSPRFHRRESLVGHSVCDTVPRNVTEADLPSSDVSWEIFRMPAVSEHVGLQRYVVWQITHSTHLQNCFTCCKIYCTDLE